MDMMQSDGMDKDYRAFGFWKEGVSIRTDRYRLNSFFRKEEPKIELFDHLIDPEENMNIAADNQKIVDSLMPILQQVTPKFYLE